jgi:hypothetical protein
MPIPALLNAALEAISPASIALLHCGDDGVERAMAAAASHAFRTMRPEDSHAAVLRAALDLHGRGRLTAEALEAAVAPQKIPAHNFHASLGRHRVRQLDKSADLPFSMVVILTGGDNDRLQYPVRGVLRVNEQNTDLRFLVCSFLPLTEDGTLGHAVSVRDPRFVFDGGLASPDLLHYNIAHHGKHVSVDAYRVADGRAMGHVDVDIGKDHKTFEAAVAWGKAYLLERAHPAA